MKIVINGSLGGFGLSNKAVKIYLKRRKISLKEFNKFSYTNEFRTDPVLINIIKKLGAAANDHFSDLKIIEIPNKINFTIEDACGREWIAEVPRKWY